MEQKAEDWRLVRAVLAGNGGAEARFTARAADAVWSSCRSLTAGETDARAAFDTAMTALRAGDFACLRGYDGRGRLESFLALVVRDVLARAVLRDVAADAQTAWRPFEALFGAALARLIQRRLPGPQRAEARQDAYQEICAGLLADNARRLAAYDGRGSPAGFVLHIADRLLLDFLRGLHARRRVPAAVLRLAPLDQELFRLVWWRGLTPEAAASVLARRFPASSEDELKPALARVHRAVPADYQPGARQLALADAPDAPDETTPETALLAQDEDRALGQAADALHSLAAGLPETERLYVRILLSGAADLPARELARLLQQPVEETYRLRQRVLKKLKEALADHEAVKNWLASV